MCGCLDLTLISRGHLLLLCWLSFDVALVFFYLYDGFMNVKGEENAHVATEVGLLMFAVCLIIITWDFERIDNLMRLEMEIKELEKEIASADEQRKRVGEIFGRHQVIVYMWLYHPLPAR